MIRFFLHSRIHDVIITGAHREREESITIDSHLMHAAGLLPFEKVEVADIENGDRVETSVLEGTPGSGIVEINGAAAHRIRQGDRVTISCYALMHAGQIEAHRPRLVFVGAENRVRELREAETASNLIPKA